jgi:hypothetical protein
MRAITWWTRRDRRGSEWSERPLSSRCGDAVRLSVAVHPSTPLRHAQDERITAESKVSWRTMCDRIEIASAPAAPRNDNEGGYGHMAQPTRSVCALKKCPCVVVTKSVVRSGPPKQQFVGRLAGTGCVSSTRPVGENT